MPVLGVVRARDVQHAIHAVGNQRGGRRRTDVQVRGMQVYGSREQQIQQALGIEFVARHDSPGDALDFLVYRVFGDVVRPLDQAVQHATTEMLRWLIADYGLDPVGASTLLGQCVRYDLGNIYDPAYTMACKLERRWLPS